MDYFQNVEAIAKELQERFNLLQYESFKVAAQIQQTMLMQLELKNIAERLGDYMNNHAKTLQDMANDNADEKSPG